MRNALSAAAALGLAALPATPAAAGPYSPAAGQVGSTAIHMDSPSLKAWATGTMNYLAGADVAASWQTPAKSLGKAVGDSFDICVLGNGGQITLTFADGIRNGDGADFAIFENSVTDTFLELAYVEVSSDGTNFVRFPSVSLTPAPVTAFGTVDPTNVNGLAGTFRQGYGTPFDLADLPASALLDIGEVSHVRVIDIVGNGDEFDSLGNVIYDPYRTTGSAGFDLEAIGVIHTVPEPAGFATLMAAAGLGILGRRRRSE